MSRIPPTAGGLISDRRVVAVQLPPDVVAWLEQLDREGAAKWAVLTAGARELMKRDRKELTALIIHELSEDCVSRTRAKLEGK